MLSVVLAHSDMLSIVQQVDPKRYDFFSRFETRGEVGIFFADV
jgi:hypothetical protein